MHEEIFVIFANFVHVQYLVPTQFEGLDSNCCHLNMVTLRGTPISQNFPVAKMCDSRISEFSPVLQ